MNATLVGCELLMMAIMAFPVVGEGQERQQQDLQFSDLRRLNWAQGFDFQNDLEWGMSVDQVQRLVGVRLRHANSNGGDTFSALLSTTWHRQRVHFGTSEKYGDGAFVFVGRNRLYVVGIGAHDCFEDDLLHALFAEFGPARHARGRIYRDGKGDPSLSMHQ